MIYLIAFLNSFSQVFLIENKFFGLLIATSIIIIKPRLGIFSVFATVCSLIFASLIGVEKSLVNSGIIGFNSVLIGIVCALFIQDNKLAIITTVLAIVLAVLIQILALKYNILVFTLPFVLVALVVFLLK